MRQKGYKFIVVRCVNPKCGYKATTIQEAELRKFRQWCCADCGGRLFADAEDIFNALKEVPHE